MQPDAEIACLITGAASGIGAALARRLILHTRRNEAGLQRAADDARNRGAEAVTLLGDLARPQACEAAVVACTATLDWFVSNAGFADKRPVAGLPADAVRASYAAITDAFFIWRTPPNRCSPKASTGGSLRFPA